MAKQNGRTNAASKYENGGVLVDPMDHGMLFDERFLDRDATLARFFTPLLGRENAKPTAEKTYRIQNSTFAYLNPRSAFVAPQIRELYDPNRIQRMGVSIRDSIDGQLQNGGVSFLDDDHVGQYLDDMNHYFETDIRPENLTRHGKFGCYIITAYGHNRQLAVASANLESNGHPDVGNLFFVKVFQNPEFWRILGNQATENTGEAPPMWVRARSIVKFQHFRKRDGHLTTKEEVARIFNVDKDQIWRAERYDALPGAVKELVMAEKLPYSGAFELDQLVGYYDEQYIVELAVRLANNRASGPQILDAVRRRITATILTPEIRFIIERDQITLLQAQELAKLAGVISDGALNDIAAWICAAHPDIADIRSKVAEIIKNKIEGKVSLFQEDSTALDDPEAMQKLSDEFSRYVFGDPIRQAISRITTYFGGLEALVESGLAGSAVDNNLIAQSTPEYLQRIIAQLIEKINALKMGEEGAGTIAELQALLPQGDASTVPVGAIDELLARLRNLLALEAGETAATQAERRAALGAEIIAFTEAPKPVQGGLF